jgi:anti-sigma-K factor RskA
MTCQDAELLLAARAVGSLDAAEVAPLEEHLQQCERCQAAVTEYVAAADLMPLALDPVPPPPSLRTRLLTQVYAEAAAAGPRAHERRWSLRGGLQRVWRGIPASRGLSAAGAAGAVAAVAITWALASHSAPSPSEPLAVQLHGTTAVPGAAGTLTYDRRTHSAVVTVQGLPPLTPQLVQGGVSNPSYELWLITSDNHPVPVAFLTQSPGSATWAAAITGRDLSGYAMVAATEEPSRGNSTPQGPEVLSATLQGVVR